MRQPIDKKNISGLTLMEILVASILATIVIAMIYSIYTSGNDLWNTKQIQAHLQAQGRLAMSQMVGELRQATRASTQTPSPNVIIPAAPGNTVIDFYLPADMDGDGTITDAVNGTIEWNTTEIIEYMFNSTGNTLVRSKIDTSGPTVLETKNLSQDVSTAKFSDITIDGSLRLNEVRIVLTLSKQTPRQRNITMNFSSIVKLRN